MTKYEDTNPPSKRGIGILIAIIIVLVLILSVAYMVTTTYYVHPGTYTLVIHYSGDGKQTHEVHQGGDRFSTPWFANLKTIDYPASVQTIKLFNGANEGISPNPDPVVCNANGIRLTADLSADFQVAPENVYQVYSQHPDKALNDTGGDAINQTVAGLVVRPVLQSSFQAACNGKTYQEVSNDTAGDVTAMINYAAQKLTKAGITLLDIRLPNAITLPENLQKSLTDIANAQAQQQISVINEQTAINNAKAAAAYNQELAQNPQALKLIIAQKMIEKWDGHGIIPSTVQNAGN